MKVKIATVLSMLGFWVTNLVGKMPLKDRLLFLKRAAVVHFLPSNDQYCRHVCSTQEIAHQRKLFGYNLEIEYQHGCGHQYHKTPKRAILYLHPWGVIGLPHKRSSDLLRRYNVLPGDVITFNFPDAGWRLPFPFYYSSFGQLSDVLPALYTLAYAYDYFDVNAIDIFGYSRGGAVAINMIAVLNDTQGTYDHVLAYIGIDTEKRKKLLELIEKGSLVLNCPLADTNATLKMYSSMVRKFFSRVTQYKVDGLQALQSVQLLQGLSLKVLLHFQYHDRRVFNIKDAELYGAFKQQNPQTTFLVLGNDGGHIHTQVTLSKAIHMFYKQVGAAYDPHFIHEDTTYLLQPALEDAEHVIQEFYATCATDKKIMNTKVSNEKYNE